MLQPQYGGTLLWRASSSHIRDGKGHPNDDGTGVGFGSRRSFLGRPAGDHGGCSLLVSRPALMGREGDESADSLRIVKVEPHLLTGVRLWAVAARARRDGRWLRRLGEGTNFPGVQPIAAASGA